MEKIEIESEEALSSDSDSGHDEVSATAGSV
jgi:hypothetical protein